MRLSESLVKLVHRDMVDPGPDPSLDHFTDADYDAHIADFLKDRPEGPIMVFCYGSLIWKPVFPPVSTARATATDWHRSFCLHMQRWRATPDVPGLMMQIDRGGECEGMVQQIAAEGELETLHTLWRREMTIKPPGNLPRWIDVEVAGRSARAIAFTANPQSPSYAGKLDLEHIADRLACACGHWGSNADYLRQTIISLNAAGIHDPYLWDMQERVARLIERRFPVACL